MEGIPRSSFQRKPGRIRVNTSRTILLRKSCFETFRVSMKFLIFRNLTNYFSILLFAVAMSFHMRPYQARQV